MVIKMTKRQICCTLPDEVLEEFEKIRDEIGLPVARQVELKLKGWSIVKEEVEVVEKENEIEVHDILDVPYYSAKEKVKEYLRNNVFISVVAEQTCLDFDVIEEVLHDLYEYSGD